MGHQPVVADMADRRKFPCNDIFSADLGAARLLISTKDLTKKSAVVWLPPFSSTFR